jgi:hypothetical protein
VCRKLRLARSGYSNRCSTNRPKLNLPEVDHDPTPTHWKVTAWMRMT